MSKCSHSRVNLYHYHGCKQMKIRSRMIQYCALIACATLNSGCKLDDTDGKPPHNPINETERLIRLAKDPTFLCDDLIKSKGALNAVAVCMAQADQGNVHAQARLGALYIKGELGSIDWANGLKYLLQAAEQNHPEAQYLVAMAYQDGNGVEKNPDQSIFWLLKSSGANFSPAQIQLGIAYLTGRGVIKDPMIAEKWLMLGANNDLEAIFAQGVAYFEGQNVAQNFLVAAHIFVYLAEKNHSKSMLMLGDLYRLKLAPEFNSEQMAYYWYNLAIQQHDASAHHHIAMIILNGYWEAPWDPILLLQSAAQKNYPPAQRELAKLYQEGIKLARDDNLAVHWYLAASHYDGEACYHLGKAYLNGDLQLAKNNKLAALYLQAAAQTDYYPAKYELATQFLEDETFLEDKFKAIEYLQPSANQGNVDAQVKLAKALMKFSLPQYDQAAFNWLTRAAGQDLQAQYLLGCCHYEGIGTRVDYNEAFRIFNDLSKVGNPLAEFKLGQMVYYGHGLKKNKPLGKSKILYAAKHGVTEAEELVKVLLQEEAQARLTGNPDQDEFDENEIQTSESKEWVDFSNDHLDPKILYQRAVNHLYGKNAYDQNIRLGLEYLHIAAEKQCVLAQRQLGHIYEQGHLVGKDLTKAQDWYLVAAKNGDHQSQFCLANLYYSGLGGHKDFIESYAWAHCASIGGKVDALFLREKIGAQLDSDQLIQAQNLSHQYAKMASKYNE